MTTTPTLNPSLTHHFVIANRADGKPYAYLADDCPDWLREAVRDAHDGESPNDWRYWVARRIVDDLTGVDAPDDDFLYDYAQVYEVADRIADVETTYTYDVLQWAAENLSRTGYYEVWLNEHGMEPAHTPVEGLRIAMFQAIHEMVITIADAIVDNVLSPEVWLVAPANCDNCEGTVDGDGVTDGPALFCGTCAADPIARKW